VNSTSFERRLFFTALTLWLSICVVSTLIHDLAPWLLDVPDTEGPDTLPGLGPAGERVARFVFAAAGAMLAFYDGWRRDGLGRTTLFAFGAMVFAGLMENAWILVASRWLGGEHYYFTTGTLWFIEVPAEVCMGWYFITYSCRELVRGVWPRLVGAWRALVVGLLAMIGDLLADPVFVNLGRSRTPASSVGMWVWEHEASATLLSIPISNFIGWMLIVAGFVHAYERLEHGLEDRTLELEQAVVRGLARFPLVLAGVFALLWCVEHALRALSPFALLPLEFPIDV
jgi:uncharacterized membrane protein